MSNADKGAVGLIPALELASLTVIHKAQDDMKRYYDQ